ncbi:MAG: hypothetical protein GF317_01080 [Candidatus Lokiarchaeota archaeon]|nr:hypothetical protein [Candidatus Lokiarchaeota archaeon]MBD3198552.1 hypothetical protein [Candidatus Lokiarchaeota archaeon]
MPPNTVMFNGSISIESVENANIVEIFMKKRILRMMIEEMTEEEKNDYIFLKLTPNRKVFCYGLGISMFKLKGKHTQGGYTVSIHLEN